MFYSRNVPSSAKRSNFSGMVPSWGLWASKWRLSSSNAKDKQDMKFSGTWGPTNQMIGHKDEFSLLRLEIELP